MTVVVRTRDLTVVALVVLVAAALWWSVAAADSAGADDETYTAVAPCAIFDSRTGQGGPGTLDGLEEWQVQITGAPADGQGATAGGCGIPATATAVQINVVAVDALTEGNLRIFEPGGTFNGGVVNYQALTPKLNNSNAVTVPIAPCTAAGLPTTERCLIIQPNTGPTGAVPTVDARGIALGFYDTALADRVATLEALLTGLSNETVDGHSVLRLTGRNLQLVDGTGDTACSGGDFTDANFENCNGLGNLIIGYHDNDDDEEDGEDRRSGAHGLIIGDQHTYTSFGHLIAGFANSTTNRYSTVAGGQSNTPSGDTSSVTGGVFNAATGVVSSVTGGLDNIASGDSSSVTGGVGGLASGPRSSVTGGFVNTASGKDSSVSGGSGNTASGESSSADADTAVIAGLVDLTQGLSRETVDGHPVLRLSGGNLQLVDGTGDTACDFNDIDGDLVDTAAADTCNGLGNLIIGYHENDTDFRTGAHGLVIGELHAYTGYGHLLAGSDNSARHKNATVAGGISNSASGDKSSVTGGSFNTASGTFSSVTGGSFNTASGTFSSITGGGTNEARGLFSSISGGGANIASGSTSSVTGGRSNTASGANASVSGGNLRQSTGQDDWRAGSLFEES